MTSCSIHDIYLFLGCNEMLDFLRRLFRPSVEPMNRIHIDKKNLIHNYKQLQSIQPQATFFPVIKSNAYGHGIKQVIQCLDWLDFPYYVVDSYPEYMLVKKYSQKNILLLGETLPQNYKRFDHRRTTFCVFNIDAIKAIAKLKRKSTIHLFFNTGMHREGIDINQIQDALDIISKYKHLTLEWVLSHLHSADDLWTESVDQQIATFKSMYYKILDAGITPTYRYIGNSAWLLKIQDDFFNAYRPWLALYGYNPLLPSDEFFDKGRKLKPALEVHSTIIAIQQLAPGHGVSYNYKRKTTTGTTAIIIPFGYAEWYSRSMSSSIAVRRKNTTLQQVGTITMNLGCIDAQDNNVRLGDKIQVISSNPDHPNSIYALSKAANTIPYEILVKIDPKIRREVI